MNQIDKITMGGAVVVGLVLGAVNALAHREIDRERGKASVMADALNQCEGDLQAATPLPNGVTRLTEEQVKRAAEIMENADNFGPEPESDNDSL